MKGDQIKKKKKEERRRKKKKKEVKQTKQHNTNKKRTRVWECVMEGARQQQPIPKSHSTNATRSNTRIHTRTQTFTGGGREWKRNSKKKKEHNGMRVVFISHESDSMSMSPFSIGIPICLYTIQQTEKK